MTELTKIILSILTSRTFRAALPKARALANTRRAREWVSPRIETRENQMPETYKNPAPTVDIVIEVDDQIVLIERKNEPHGWALPGGFVDYGETTERAARREATEETGLDVQLLDLLGVYSDPNRDPRKHTISTVYVARAQGRPEGADDASTAELFAMADIPSNLCFDHTRIVEDYRTWRATH